MFGFAPWKLIVYDLSWLSFFRLLQAVHAPPKESPNGGWCIWFLGKTHAEEVVLKFWAMWQSMYYVQDGGQIKQCAFNTVWMMLLISAILSWLFLPANETINQVSSGVEAVKWIGNNMGESWVGTCWNCRAAWMWHMWFAGLAGLAVGFRWNLVMQ